MTDTGDTSPGSGLAFDRFAAANAFSVLRYERTIKIQGTSPATSPASLS